MDFRRSLLWIDSSGGLIVGVIVLSLCPVLAVWYNLPLGLIIAMGMANIGYGCFSLSLAKRQFRPLFLIRILAAANLLWAICCFVFVGLWVESISVLGTVHLLGEGVYVGGMGILEFRWSKLLIDGS